MEAWLLRNQRRYHVVYCSRGTSCYSQTWSAESLLAGIAPERQMARHTKEEVRSPLSARTHAKKRMYVSPWTTVEISVRTWTFKTPGTAIQYKNNARTYAASAPNSI